MSFEPTLESVLIEKLRRMYQAERELGKLLPKLIKGAKSDDVKAVLQRRLEESSEHLVRLEVAFDTLDRGMAGTTDHEGHQPSDRAKALAGDADALAEAQRLQHPHIAVYRTLASWAKALGYDHVGRLLLTTLEQEVSTDTALEGLAEAGLNELVRSGQAGRPDTPEVRAAAWLLRSNDDKRPILKDFTPVVAK